MSKEKIKIAAFVGIIALILCSYFGTIFMCIATVNYFLILIGFLFRISNRRLHVSLITLGILSDLILVLTLEFQRDAIATAMSFKLSPLNQAHILCSTLATILYFPMVYTGIMIIKQRASRVWHKRFGYMVIIFRSMGFILMFSMLKSLKNL